MEKHYTVEKHTRILIALMKFHGIRKIIASPGMTCVCLIGSIQDDPFFELYSSVDERSAAFIACGMAAESGEPVALVCTGSTASRNYVPGLTEAYYRKLPVLAITTTQHLGRVGNLNEQVIDRSHRMTDLVRESVVVDVVQTDEDEWACGLNINRALIALTANGGGPAHINLVTTYNKDFSARTLPTVKGILFHDNIEDIPKICDGRKVAVLAGVHTRWSQKLLSSVEDFCEKCNAVVFASHASNYAGAYGVLTGFLKGMGQIDGPVEAPDLLIHIGGVVRCLPDFGDCEVWRVSMDGKVVDPTKKLTEVFQLDEAEFFERLASASEHVPRSKSYAAKWQEQYMSLVKELPELPYSNVWIAKETIDRIPSGSVLHLAGSNTAYSWNLFELPAGVECYSNDGTMGIDGQVSALLGESLASPNRLHIGVCGDLTLFYDMNCLGNRHVGNNLRIIVINNGMGALFKIYSATAAAFGERTDPFMAAAGHFGNKSPDLLRHYAEDLGYEYLSASTKAEYVECLNRFLTKEATKRPMLLEVFTDAQDESDARFAMEHLGQNSGMIAKELARDAIRALAGERGVNAVKKALGR